MTWTAKRDHRVELPDGSARWVFADRVIPAELVDLVPAGSRKRTRDGADADAPSEL